MALKLEIIVDNKGAIKGIRDTTGALKEVGKTGSKSGANLFETFSKFKGLIAGAAVVSVIKFTKELTNLASRSEETSNKFSTLFNNIGDLNTRVLDLRKETGYASTSLQTFLSDIGALIKPAGFASNVAYDMSEKITKLALDLSSFHNVASQNVIEDFRSALAGSSETLEKYGINVKDGAIAVEAFRLGLTKSVKEYSKLDAVTRQNVRTQALISKAYRDSKDAIGDLAKTQNTYANQSRILDENLQELGEGIGTLLLPMITELTKGTNAATKAILDLANIETNVKRKARLESELKALQDYSIEYQKIIDNTKKELGLNENMSAFDELRLASALGEKQETLDKLAAEKGILKILSERTKLNVVTADQMGKAKSTTQEQTKDLFLQNSLVEDHIKQIETELGLNQQIATNNEQNLEIKKQENEEHKKKKQYLNEFWFMATELNNLAKERVKNAQEESVKLVEISQVENKRYTDAITGNEVIVKQSDKIRENMINYETDYQKFNRVLGKSVNTINTVKGLLSEIQGILKQFEKPISKWNFGDFLNFGGSLGGMVAGGGGGLFGGVKKLFGFASGGSFTVGGSGGTDSQLVQFKATPGEKVTVSPPGGGMSNININISANSFDENFVRFNLIPLLKKVKSDGVFI